MPVSNSLQRDQFYYFWDLSRLGVTAGDEIEYYFEVWDNDGVHGAKIHALSENDLFMRLPIRN